MMSHPALRMTAILTLSRLTLIPILAFTAVLTPLSAAALELGPISRITTPGPVTRIIKTKPVLSNFTVRGSWRRGSYFPVSVVLKPRHTAGSYPVKVYIWSWTGSRWLPLRSVMAKAVDFEVDGKPVSRCIAHVRINIKGRFGISALAPEDYRHYAASTPLKFITIF